MFKSVMSAPNKAKRKNLSGAFLVTPSIANTPVSISNIMKSRLILELIFVQQLYLAALLLEVPYLCF